MVIANVEYSGAHAPSYLYRIVADHYKPEDINFNRPELQA
jgi:translation initiation factor eIF-2B subunit beta